MVVLGILAAIALPKLRGAIDKADAAIIVEDARTILLAGVQALHDNGQFPPDAGDGVLPTALEPYLGEGFDFYYQDIIPYTWKSDTSGGVSTAFVYVDYSTHPGIARAMRAHEGNNAIWTETQMIFFLSQ
jgi:type II secretory pathway pseudopilin PulG